MKKLLLFVFTILVFSSFEVFSQVIKPSGTSDRPAGQKIFWFDNDQITSDRATSIQITNTHDVDPVWIHVTFLGSRDNDDDII